MNWKERVDELVPRLRPCTSVALGGHCKETLALIEELAGHLDLLDSVARGVLSYQIVDCGSNLIETERALEDTLRFLDGVSEAPPEGFEQVGWLCTGLTTKKFQALDGPAGCGDHTGCSPLYIKRGTE